MRGGPIVVVGTVLAMRDRGPRAIAGTHLRSTRPRLVCLPSRDRDFAAHVEAVLVASPKIQEPAELQAALRPDYPRVLVRASELSGLRTPTWYVYRDGSFPWSE